MEVNEHHLHVVVRGSQESTPILLLHHGLGSVRAWKAQLPVLVDAGYRVVAYDRWGYGKSDSRPALDLPEFADDLIDLECILQRYIPGEFYLVGHSDGGKIAMLYAARNPQRVRKLVLISSQIYLEPKMHQGIRSVKTMYDQDAEFRMKFRRVHGGKAGQVFDNWYTGWTGLGASQTGKSWDMRPLIAQICCPTLVVQGIEDEHVSPQHAHDIAEAIPDAELWLIPGVGHMVPQDAAEEFNKRLLAFLSEDGSEEKPVTILTSAD